MAEKEHYKIKGMDCAEEVAALRDTVGRLPGVSNLDFDLLNCKMTVTFEPDTVNAEDIISAASKASLEALCWEDAEAMAEDEGFWQRNGRMVMCIIGGSLLVAGFSAHAILHGGIVDAFVAGDVGGERTLPLVSILLYVGSVAISGWFIFPKAFASARDLRADMNLLMIIAVCGAMIIGEWFEAGAVTFLFAVALLLESWSVGRARKAVGALLDLAPTTARYICPTDGDIEEKPVEDVPVGVTALVRPGEKIPLDGIVTKGITSVNQAPITGESISVPKEAGDEVFAGTINDEGAFEFKVSKSAIDTTLAQIIRMVEESQSRRAPSEQWVEKFARYYTPTMIVLAIVVAIIPPLILSDPWITWVYRALVLLVIACPCALVISTPVSIVSGLTSASRNGILIKGGVYLEAPAELEAIALDKTGTLTRGCPEVQAVVPLNGHTDQELLAKAAALEVNSEHPLARAILRKAEAEGVKFASASDFQAMKGKGAVATIEGRTFWIGSHRLMEEKGQETTEVHYKALELEKAGHSVVAVGNDNHVCGLISIADGVRDQAASTVRALKDIGVKRIVMLTGDNEGTARAVAESTGVDDFRAELLPEDKVNIVELLVKELDHVAMVGDGVNDAPAMATATLGIAMGSAGTDAAIETADIALMSDDLSKIPWLIRHSRRTMRVIKQNIWFALGLKLVFMGLAMAGIATLWMAIAADMGASLLVIFNGLRLLGGTAKKINKRKV
ncbi:MAG: heavy metal translocating P-type ATPase [Deltaproteobacteria bacterium]|nr:heavy metal translocating P-type ATPase [Deltaproteobacteria bacterium]